jgi:uncharacterized RDD family membrane protein YckC
VKDALQRVLPQAVKDSRRWITPEPLNVAPALVGAALGTPVRRAWAMGLDLLVVALLSGASGLWLWLGLGLVLLQLRQRQRSAPASRRVLVGWVGAALVLLLALQEAQQRYEAWRHPEVAAAAVKAEEAADLAEAAEAVRSVEMPASAASAPVVDLAQRVARLEAELAEARKPKKLHLRDRVSEFLDDIGAGLGWGIVYFSLLPAWWGGQTVGKKLFGLRIVELTGKPMTVMRSLKRYGGYAAGLATGGLGFLQIVWDPNRQGLHDKAAHTAVIDLRAAATAPAPEPGPETG